MAEPRRTAHGEASRERILEAAIELFAERGFPGASVSAICQRAGVVKTALYWHFESKQGLLSAALERAASTWIEQIQKSTYEVSEPDDRLDRFVAGLRDLVENHHEILSLLLTMTLQRIQLEPEIHEAMQRVDARAMHSITQGIEDALGRSVPDLDLVAWTALSLLDGVTFAYRNDPEGTDLDRLFQHMKEMIALSIFQLIQKAEGECKEGEKP